jgi:short-subunit dehydrogenase
VALTHLRADGGTLINMGSLLGNGQVGAVLDAKHSLAELTDALRGEVKDQALPVVVVLIQGPGDGSGSGTHTQPVSDLERVADAVLYAAEHATEDLKIPFATFDELLSPRRLLVAAALGLAGGAVAMWLWHKGR